jgi:hypothetical protein
MAGDYDSKVDYDEFPDSGGDLTGDLGTHCYSVPMDWFAQWLGLLDLWQIDSGLGVELANHLDETAVHLV